MKTIQIACVPSDWDASTITAVGLTRNGRRALPITRTARDLPEPWISIWHGLVETLRGVAPGEWAATFIIGHYVSETVTAADDNTEAQIITPEHIELIIHRKWDDNTTADPVQLTMDQPEAVAFFNYLTS